MPDINPNDVGFYVILAAAAVSLVFAFLSMARIARAAGFLCLAVSIAMVAIIVKGPIETIYIWISGFALLGAVAFISQGGTAGDNDMNKPH